MSRREVFGGGIETCVTHMSGRRFWLLHIMVRARCDEIAQLTIPALAVALSPFGLRAGGERRLVGVCWWQRRSDHSLMMVVMRPWILYILGTLELRPQASAGRACHGFAHTDAQAD